MDDELVLTDGDLQIISESLNYSVQRVSDYPHLNYDHKRESLRPIKAARDKVRLLMAMRKESAHGR